MEIISLAKLNDYIGQVIEINFDAQIQVKAEIHQCNASRGHYYLDLVEKEESTDQIIARQSAALWRNTHQFLYRKHGSLINDILVAGNEISFLCQVEFHPKFGLKLIIQDIDTSFTLGELEKKKRELLETIRKRGWENRNARVPMPCVLQRIAVISSRDAAGYADFTDHLLANQEGHRYVIHLFQSAMQGAGVEKDVTDRLKMIEARRENYDCVCILRGGGSKLDLAAFDSLRIAESIAFSSLPVITGIGHEIDTSIADLVSHQMVKTPTAVAGYILQHNERFLDEIWNLGLSISNMIRSRMQLEAEWLNSIGNRIRHQMEMFLERQQALLSSSLEKLLWQSSKILDTNEHSLQRTSEAIRAADPRALLQKGYSITIHEGKVVRNAAELSLQDQLTTLLAAGRVDSTITSKSEDHE